MLSSRKSAPCSPEPEAAGEESPDQDDLDSSDFMLDADADDSDSELESLASECSTMSTISDVGSVGSVGSLGSLSGLGTSTSKKRRRGKKKKRRDRRKSHQFKCTKLGVRQSDLSFQVQTWLLF